MVTLITDKTLIQRSQADFRRRMDSVAEKRGRITVSFRPEDRVVEARWSRTLGIWWAIEPHGSKESENRFWNVFGLGEPKWGTKHGHKITVEINFPVKGLDRRVAAVFATNDKGGIDVLHSGKIGGGKTGIGKAKFESYYSGPKETVVVGTEPYSYARIGWLDGTILPQQVAKFVHEVDRIKAMP